MGLQLQCHKGLKWDSITTASQYCPGMVSALLNSTKGL